MARFDVNKMAEFLVTIISNGESGQINGKSGQIKLVKAYDIESQDNAVLKIIFNNPGIKLEAIFLKIKTSNRCVRRTLKRLSFNNKIECRGSKHTGQCMSQIVSSYP